MYSIKNLQCKYKTNQFPVLNIEDLEIVKGEVVFFLGASGVGKSTILETLGIMNNTIYKRSNSKFDFNFGSTNTNMLDIWKFKEGDLAQFRKNHLSFIFQSTNLFPNLNAEDNVLLTPMLQGLNEVEAKNKIRPIFKKIFTKEYKEILDNKKISEMSGGQRQRLAFVRAISSAYTLLLADEPTGNLDWANANNLMNHLIDDIKAKQATAVIVSHDISLAVEHADKIVYIDKLMDKELGYHYGNIDNKNTFIKQEDGSWINKMIYTDKPPKISSELLIGSFKQKIIKQNSIHA